MLKRVLQIAVLVLVLAACVAAVVDDWNGTLERRALRDAISLADQR